MEMHLANDRTNCEWAG